MDKIDYQEIDIQVARHLGWKIDIEQVPDIWTIAKSTRTIPLYMVIDDEGKKWSPSHSLRDVALPHYSKDIWSAFEAAEKISLLGEQESGLDVVLYRADDKWQVCSVNWGWQEIDIIASADTVPLVICKAIIALKKEKE